LSLISLLRGVWLLRHPHLVRRLGELLTAERALQDLRARYPTARIHDDAEIIDWRNGALQLGDGVTIEKGTIVTLGDSHNGYGAITIGAGSWIGQYNNLRVTGGTRLSIGANCLISQFCTLVTSNHQTQRARLIQSMPTIANVPELILGNDVWVGAGTCVLPGVVVHDGAVIGANSVVTNDVPAYEIWAGNPARKISQRT
jgi:carbonic anhydrase/acetyltransferase-like protein (isoleucine patch superfamily)